MFLNEESYVYNHVTRVFLLRRNLQVKKLIEKRVKFFVIGIFWRSIIAVAFIILYACYTPDVKFTLFIYTKSLDLFRIPLQA